MPFFVDVESTTGQKYKVAPGRIAYISQEHSNHFLLVVDAGGRTEQIALDKEQANEVVRKLERSSAPGSFS